MVGPVFTISFGYLLYTVPWMDQATKKTSKDEKYLIIGLQMIGY